MSLDTINSKKYLNDIVIKPQVVPEIILGSIVTLKSHPYQFNDSAPIVGSYMNFTPPLMIVIEVLIKKDHHTDTGIKNSNQFKCLYYSSKSGTFEKIWFKAEELKFIKKFEETDFDIKGHSIKEWKSKTLGLDVVLQTVDLELGKKKVFFDEFDGKIKNKTNTLLEYLPPIGTIIDVKIVEDKIRYHEKTGEPTSKIYDVEAKIKWLNNESGKFSEEYLPIKCLKIVTFNESSVKYLKNTTYVSQLKYPKSLESTPELSMMKVPVMLKSIVFNHYYYNYELLNRFNKACKTEKTGFSNMLLNYNQLISDGKLINDSLNIQTFFEVTNFHNYSQKWFQIQYKDRDGNFTERIIYVKVLLDDKVEGKKNLIIVANCLLRDGNIRHFTIERIKQLIELPISFEQLFFERKQSLSTAPTFGSATVN